MRKRTVYFFPVLLIFISLQSCLGMTKYNPETVVNDIISFTIYEGHVGPRYTKVRLSRIRHCEIDPGIVTTVFPKAKYYNESNRWILWKGYWSGICYLKNGTKLTLRLDTRKFIIQGKRGVYCFENEEDRLKWEKIIIGFSKFL